MFYTLLVEARTWSPGGVEAADHFGGGYMLPGGQLGGQKAQKQRFSLFRAVFPMETSTDATLGGPPNRGNGTWGSPQVVYMA